MEPPMVAAAGDRVIGHRASVIPKKDGERTLHTTVCACGWRGPTQQTRTGALDEFDKHIQEEKRA